MIKLFIYTLSLVIIVLAFMILTIVSYEGLVLGGLGWKIFFPAMVIIGSILLMYHAHHFWCRLLKVPGFREGFEQGAAMGMDDHHKPMDE